VLDLSRKEGEPPQTLQCVVAQALQPTAELVKLSFSFVPINYGNYACGSVFYSANVPLFWGELSRVFQLF
jgi:hypothetical protein